MSSIAWSCAARSRRTTNVRLGDAAAARPRDGVVPVLTRLAARYARVGVVSGRPVSFLLAHLGGTGVRRSGLYGLEWAEGEDVVTHPDAERWRDVVDRVAVRAE